MTREELIALIIVAIVSSLPTLLIASVLGIISIFAIWTLVSPWIPLIAMLLIGKFIYDAVKEEYPLYGLIIFIIFLIIGLILTFTIGFGYRVGGPEVW